MASEEHESKSGETVVAAGCASGVAGGRTDVVINNDGTPEELRKKVEGEWEKLQERI